MDGRDRSCGAVAGVSRSKSPVRLARAIMERSPHVMFMGNGADELNAELGLDVVEPEYFITDLRRRQLRKAQQHDVIVLDHRSEEHTSELQSLMRISYAVFCLKKNTYTT